MESDSHLPNFITLGQRLYLLSNMDSATLLAKEIPLFLKSLEECGLHRARIAAKPLNASIVRHNGYGRITAVAAIQLRAYVESVEHILYEEAGERTLITINTGGVLETLRLLPSTLQLTAIQQRLCDETVACIERGAFRAAIIMGWNLAYDYIRQWVYNMHLDNFNKSLTTEYIRKTGNSVYDPIVNYEDFFSGAPSERVVIDTCFAASLFGKRLCDNLRFHLRRRNEYAHTTFQYPTREQTNAYVKDLIDIITQAPFGGGNAGGPDSSAIGGPKAQEAVS